MTKKKQAQNQIICFGELIVDCFGSIEDGFVPKFGGAPANTVIGLAKLGQKNLIYSGKVGTDFFGEFMIKTMRGHGVNTKHVVRDVDHKTTLAFVSLGPDGQRDFSFVEGAHNQITKKDVKDIPMQSARIMQFGSILQSNAECRAATDYLITAAHKNKVYLSYDPNVRLVLWKDLVELKRIILGTIPKVDMLKLNEEEMEFLTGSRDPKKVAKKIWKNNLQALFLTLGAKGVYWKTQTDEGFVKTVKVKAIDTTGAGDAFNAAMLYQLYPSIHNGRLKITSEQLQAAAYFANRVAGMSTLKKGAIEALPTLAEVNKKLK